MTNPEGETKSQLLRLDFDRRRKLEFHGSRVTSDAGLLAYRELDDALGLTPMVGDELVDPRTGKNGQHGMKGLFRQSVFGRLGGYEHVNDANRLGRDPAMRWIVGGRAVAKAAASTSQMGRFEIELLATDQNLAALLVCQGNGSTRQILSNFRRRLAAFNHGAPACVGTLEAARCRIWLRSCRLIALSFDARGGDGVIWA